MGSLKNELRTKVESDQERGNEIQEHGDEKLNEAIESNEAMSEIEAVDDDDKAAVEAARSEADRIGKLTAESEIRNPGKEVGESLKETSEQAVEYSEQEMEDAGKAAEMTGDYSGTGSELSSTLTESGEQFQEIADVGDEVNDQMAAELDKIASALEENW